MKDVNENKLKKEIIFNFLPKFKDFSLDLEIFNEVNSTNSYLLEKVQDENVISICLAEKQSSGRGRSGKVWQSPKNQNIYLSMSFLSKVSLNKFEGFSLFTALNISKAIKKLYSFSPLIKWPNDLFLNDKKFGGILIETKSINGKLLMVIGIGLNVRMKENEYIDQKWTSIQKENPLLEIDRNELIAGILSEIINDLSLFERNGFKYFKEDYESLHMLKNQRVISSNHPEEKCIALDVNEDGSLNLIIGKKKNIVTSGEVSLKIQK